jgi:hypothetical protein
MAYNRKYHTEKELKEIQNWDIKDAHNLVNRLRDMWEYNDYFIENWGFDHIHKERPVLMLELHTGGWSGNEDIVEALQKNKMFWIMWWWKTERGGHYYFEIDFSAIGFKPVEKFTKENKISRQYVSKAKAKFEWVKISQNKRLIRAMAKV